MILDYRVRGFTRDLRGKKHFFDHDITSIQYFISRNMIDRYSMVDVKVYQENLFHTKMPLKEFDLDNYLFGLGRDDYSPRELRDIEQHLKVEMAEIYYGRNLPGR